MSVINTNITSLIGQHNLSKSQSALQTSMERLSSGLRINSAKDDAAGQAIANRMTAQITGLAQAQRNANDGISIAQTAEGGLNQINDNLQRVRELSVQAANGTNSSSDLQSIQDEINQRLEEIDRISRETDFNGTRVLSEDAETLSIQVGSQDGQVIEVNLSTINSETLKLGNFDIRNASFDTAKLDDATAVNLSTESLLASDPTTVVAAATFEVQDVTFADTNPPAADPIQIFADDTNTNVFYAFDGTNYYEGVTLDADTNTFSFTSANITATPTDKPDDASADELSADDYVDLGNGETVLFKNTVIDSGDVSAPDEAELFVDSSGALFASYDGGTTTYSANIDLDGQVTFDSNGGTGTTETFVGSLSQVIEGYKIPVGEVTAQTTGIAGDFDAEPEIYALADNPGSYVVKGEQDGETVYFEAVLSDEDGTITLGEQIVQLDTSSLGDDAQVFQLEDGSYVAKGTENGADTYYKIDVAENGSVTVGDKLNADPLAALDAALSQVDTLRSELGAVQNRFEDAITNLNTNETNLSAARSRIEDADYAVEVANMTRAQILQQAGTSVLAQANQIPQIALSLLG